ncbi:MAG: hypothetical protein KME03_10900 [Aphanocapsa lilacina HA4352-LM1]|nr:hypothetical protein [Aphanocapsa lilacina HA4352-LM1]
MPALGGELAALAAAFLWAVGSVIWSLVGRRILPLELNLIKITIAMALAVPALWLAGTGLACATSPLFVLPIAAWMGEKVGYRAVLGVLVSLGGVALLIGQR